MAVGILRLSDGTDTIDFHSSDYRVLKGGVSMPPPTLDSKFISSQFVDGDRLANVRYGNRTIDIKFLIVGSSLDDLRTNARAIQRLLNDARYRNLIGQGNQVYLEYQWGTNVGESVYFDVNYGELILPGDFSSPKLWRNNLIENCTLRLNCEPFGRYANQDIAQETLENFQNAYIITESFLVDDNGTHQLDDADWEAQTFTTTSAYTAVGAMIKGYRLANPTDLTLALYATAASKPTGSAIATGTVTISNIPTSSFYYGWVKVRFDSGVALNNATEYALVAHCDDGAGNGFLWRTDSTAGYAGGQRCFSANSGTDWTADATDDNLFAILKADTDANYQDIITSEAYGDIPAKLYWKLAPSNATGTNKIWLAKRSGDRYDDDLWQEGEDYLIRGNSGSGYSYEEALKFPSTTESGQMYAELVVNNAGGIAANTAIGYFLYNFPTPPKGNFRVLARCRAITQDASDFDHVSWGVGWTYGNMYDHPTEVEGRYYQCAAHNTWEILDLGLLNLPPAPESEIATSDEFNLFIWTYATDAFTAGEWYKWDIDWVFLLPIDEGVVIIDNTLITDRIVMDGITNPPNVLILDTTHLIIDYPDYVGRPFTLGRENTRLYVVRDDDNSVIFASDVKYQPQFLIV